MTMRRRTNAGRLRWVGYPSGTTLPGRIRTSVAWRVTPVFEKIARRCVRAVFLLIPDSSAASSSVSPVQQRERRLGGRRDAG